jgi:hypothetical protein
MKRKRKQRQRKSKKRKLKKNKLKKNKLRKNKLRKNKLRKNMLRKMNKQYTLSNQKNKQRSEPSIYYIVCIIYIAKYSL